VRTDHPPRDKQAREPTDESLSLLENALREDEPSLGGGEHTEDIDSLFEEDVLPPLACHASGADDFSTRKHRAPIGTTSKSCTIPVGLLFS
jgi:hypothetical protein